MSVKPAWNAGKISSVPSAEWAAPSPFGIWEVSVKGLHTVPIGFIETTTLEPPVLVQITRNALRKTRASKGGFRANASKFSPIGAGGGNRCPRPL